MKTHKHNVTRHLTRMVLYLVSACLIGAAFAGFAASPTIGMQQFDPLTVFTVATTGFALAMTLDHYVVNRQKERPGVFSSAIAREWWVNYIMNELFPKNSFMDRCFNEDDYVVGGKTVHIPQAAAHPAIVKNRASFPATAVERTDTEVSYDLDSYSSDPIRIRNAEQAELSYDKTASVLSAMMEKLRTRVAEDLAYKWAPTTAAQIVRTTGALSTLNLPNGTATGQRRILTFSDVRQARKVLNKQDVAYEGRVLLLDSNMLDELMNDPVLQVREVQAEVDYKNGVIARILGFDVMERSKVLKYDNTATPVPLDPSAADATTDNGGALAYGPTYVARAMGEVQFYENVNDALHYGNVYSSDVRCGGRKRYTNGRGVVALVQAAS